MTLSRAALLRIAPFAAFMGLLNSKNLSGDQLSVVFWQRWDAAIGNSSSVWFRSAASGNRGFQGHLPWGEGTIYFDHSGCCAAPAQRLNIASSSVPGLNWQQWTHVALIRRGMTARTFAVVCLCRPTVAPALAKRVRMTRPRVLWWTHARPPVATTMIAVVSPYHPV